MPNETPHVPWVMPSWMEPLRDFIVNTGGNPIEELMNDHDTTMFANAPRVMLIASVSSQVAMLERMHAAQQAMPVDTEAVPYEELEVDVANWQPHLVRHGDGGLRVHVVGYDVDGQVHQWDTAPYVMTPPPPMDVMPDVEYVQDVYRLLGEIFEREILDVAELPAAGHADRRPTIQVDHTPQDA